MSEDMTTGEIVRRLDEMSQRAEDSSRRMENRLDALTTELREERRVNTDTYVTNKVHDLAEKAIRAHVDAAVKDVADDVHELKKSREADHRWKQQVTAGIAIGVIVMIVQIVLTVAFSTGGLS